MGEFAPGTLHPNAKVDFTNDSVVVTHGLWEVRLPAEWVAARPDVARFLRGRLPRQELAPTPETLGVLELLDRQGCIVPAPLRGVITLRALRDRFERIRGGWYAEYNSHPLWERLRTGKASRNELLAYLTHNYHISRAAGVTAARMAVRGPVRWRSFFVQDASEEYWHCDAYYFVQSQALGCPDRSIAEYVPLPASSAFEQHTLQLADHDGLANLLIAYFQESSVMFREDADTFYDEVSRVYGLAHFFDPWRAHIGIDVQEAHADGFAALFDDEVIDAKTAKRSLALAWAGYHFLCASLGDAHAEARDDDRIILRDRARLARQETAPVPVGELATIDLHHVVATVAKSALVALASGREHDEIIVAGLVAKQLHGVVDRQELPKSPWTLAVANFVMEAAVRPNEWGELVARLASWIPLAIDVEQLTKRFRPERSAIELARFDELLHRWARDTVEFPEEIWEM